MFCSIDMIVMLLTCISIYEIKIQCKLFYLFFFSIWADTVYQIDIFWGCIPLFNQVDMKDKSFRWTSFSHILHNTESFIFLLCSTFSVSLKLYFGPRGPGFIKKTTSNKCQLFFYLIYYIIKINFIFNVSVALKHTRVNISSGFLKTKTKQGCIWSFHENISCFINFSEHLKVFSFYKRPYLMKPSE